MSSNALEPQKEPVVVFVVEDESALQDILGAALDDAGFGVMVAQSGHEAIKILERQDAPIRALVTDIDLGTQVTGWDVARRARELQADIPVVYMTGANADDWSDKGVPNSILIAKPFVPTQLVVAV